MNMSNFPSARELTGTAGNPGNGSYFTFTATLSEGLLATVKFTSVGCPWSALVGISASSMIEGRPLTACSELTVQAITKLCGQIPRSKEELPRLACEAIKALAVSGTVHGGP